MSDQERKWFEVEARLKIKAADEADAINGVAHVISTRKIKGLYPVGEFSARPCPDPTRRQTRTVA